MSPNREPAARNWRKSGNLAYAGAWELTLLLVLGAWLGLAPTARGFALLGPYAPWMTAGVGYDPAWRVPDGDIGGPMALGEEYRWNIPVVTYGFDRSFLDYFGQGGVDAVEQAIQILNDLPPASSMVLSNYPIAVVIANYRAKYYNCYDMKSATLYRLLEQMGLAEPLRYCYVLRRWEPNLAAGSSGAFDEAHMANFPWLTNCVECRNFDPGSQSPSPFVNSSFCTWRISTSDLSWLEPWVSNSTTDPYAYPYRPVMSDFISYAGEFYYRGLAQDDAGGLLYLLSRTNVNVESLDDSVGPVNTDDSFVRLAPRPGIEKLTFVRHPTAPTGGFATLTNQFADAYFTNGLLATQLVQRVVVQPDFLFSTGEPSVRVYTNNYGIALYLPASCQRRTDTSRWTNGNVLNGNPDGDGPGVIRPPVKIAFATPGRYVAAAGGQTYSYPHFSLYQWASIGMGTNLVIFPGNQTNLTSLTLSTRLVNTNGASELEWTMFGRPGANYRIEGSADLTVWTTNSVLTNTNGVFQFSQPADGTQHFFRAVLEN